MTLSTHTLVGVAAATLTPANPLAGFALGFASHFLIDAIPHWDYHLGSMKEDTKNPMNSDMVLNKAFLFDLIKITGDGLLGLVLALLLFGAFWHYSPVFIFAAAFGSVLPDGLQFVYMKWRHEPLKSLQRFHLWIHTEIHLHEKLSGIFFQAVLILLAVLVFKII